MTRYLFTTLPTNDLGLLTRSLPIAHELRQQGHTVLFSSPAKAPSRLIADAGFANLVPRHPIGFFLVGDFSLRGLRRIMRGEYGNPLLFLPTLARDVPLRTVPPTTAIWNMNQMYAMAGMLSTRLVYAYSQAMIRLIHDSQPDVVVDFWNPFAVIAARATQTPLVTVIQADAHPANNGFIWWKTPPDDLPDPTHAINRALDRLGVIPIRKAEDLCVGNLTLVVGTPETDPLPPDADVTYIGAVLWQQSDAALPVWVNDLRPDQPVIWLYPGNPHYGPSMRFISSDVVIRACIGALADKPVQVVLTTGHHKLPQDVLPLPANFRHATYVPGLAMAEHSDLLIHHGGYGSCQTGLFTGTPAVIIPTFSERESNARRVAAVGAGEFILPVSDSRRVKHVDAGEVWSKVEQILADPAYTTNAQRISEKLRAYGGAEQAAQLIEAFADDPATIPEMLTPRQSGEFKS